MKTKSILSVLMAFLMLPSMASAVEIRGTVVETNNLNVFDISGDTSFTWTAQQFAGFYYDLDKGEQFESLKINGINGRTIEENELIYTTGKIPVDFEYYKNKGQKFEGKSSYDLVGWEAEKWVAVNGKVNKLSKLLINDESEKRSLQNGGSLTLGNGYVLKIQAVDANAEPRQAWIQLLKDGAIIDDGVIQYNTTYTYTKTVGGEQDVLVLAAYVSSIFAGQEASMIQFQYLWMIDESKFIEVKSGTKYGVFEANIVGDTIELTNPSTITLSKDSEVTLMGNMKFKVADSETLRFYPFVDIVNNGSVSTSLSGISGQTIVYVDRWNNNTNVSAPVIVEKVVEKIVYVTATPAVVDTAASTAVAVTPKKDNVIPGFEAIFAIAGLIAVAFIVLRQKRKD